MSKVRNCLFLGISVLALGMLGGCGKNTDDKVVLRIASSEEYIDEGGWDADEAIELDDATIFGENSMVEDFEKWYKETYGVEVEVEYSTFGTNEELYNQMNLGNVFDLVCPSEYMIMKLMDEGRLQPLSDSFYDSSDQNNYYTNGVSPYIEETFENLTHKGESISKYAACYMWGTMGIVYNPQVLSEEDVAHWSVLLNKDYYKRVTMKDSVRDSFFVAQCIANEEKVMTNDYLNDPNYYDNLSELQNDTSQEAVDRAESILSDMRKNAYSLETDSGKADMITGKVVANMQWSGDAVYTMDQAEEDGFQLNYSVPEECTNLWFDGWVMMKNGIEEDSRKQQAAEAFINFVSKPENAIRNMNYIGYTSGISGGDSDLIKEYVEWLYGAEEGEDTTEYDLSYFFGDDYSLTCSVEQTERQLFAQYPTEDVIGRAVVMRFFDEDANKRIMQMWTNIRCFDLGF
jgi:spermidine/putrescine transport system substrate-binding protein